MGRQEYHVTMLSLYIELCRTSTRVLLPLTIFSGFAVNLLTAPVSGVLYNNPGTQLNKMKIFMLCFFSSIFSSPLLFSKSLKTIAR